ncbi:MAG: hypothetical protein HC809_01840 [Gammaproteobacteria bacterium]|nr:hypothetical protein [Gammaproteobacteria bacterium]
MAGAGSVELIRTMEEALAGRSGSAFFDELVKVVARVVDVPCAFIAELVSAGTHAAPPFVLV